MLPHVHSVKVNVHMIRMMKLAMVSCFMDSIIPTKLAPTNYTPDSGIQPSKKEYLTFDRPEKCEHRKFVREMDAKSFGTGNVKPVEFEAEELGVME